MYEIDKKAIELKIIESKFSDNYETNKAIIDSLLSITKTLCDYTHDVSESLLNKNYDREDNYEIGDIYTALLPANDDDNYESVGLYKMVDDLPYRVFLDCEYEEIRDIVGDLSERKEYKGNYVKEGKILTFDYSFEFDNSFLRAQERLFEYDERYCLKNPLVLSPYSHKSFYLKFDDSLKDKNIELDFCFESNQLPVIAGNYNLYWNIRQSLHNSKTYDAKVPYGSITKYLYFFKKSKKGRYLLPLPLNNQSKLYEVEFNERGVEIVIDRDIEDFIELEYVDLDQNSTIVKELKSKNKIFDNKISNKTQRNRRILSDGDIERAIGCFREWKKLYCKRSQGNSGRIIRYSKKYRTFPKNKIIFNCIRSEYIYFESSNKVFLMDYANYILEYLEYFYPEIEWAGVY